MTQEDPPRPHRSLRDVSLSLESKGTKPRTRCKMPRFVIHKHQARNLHYDLRLEVDGVLKSWAVPKGPSTDPGIKRLAVSTEDHSIKYIDFEDAIPEGEYGAGATIVWDTGTYRNLTENHGEPVSMQAAITQGHVSVWLEGKKLKGGFGLNRFRTGEQDQWLLVKMKDDEANPDEDPVASQPESVVSGRTVEDVAKGVPRQSTVHRDKKKRSKPHPT